MTMQIDDTTIVCIGPSHKTASLADRERFALSGAAARELCDRLAALDDVCEIVAVATCNRSELYLVVARHAQTTPQVVEAFAEFANVDEHARSPLIAVREGDAAVSHLMRVAAGLESVVVGEAQIQGQLKQALADAQRLNRAGAVLSRLFTDALAVGKRARSETEIGSGHASVGSVAATLVERCLERPLSQARMVVVGAGKMGSLAARSLTDRGATHVDVANRSLTRARRVADDCGGAGIAFADLDEELVTCDAVVSSTDAPHFVITRERIQQVMHRRGGRPLVLVDLAVPRDIEPDVADVDGCHLFDLDDLERVVATTLDTRSEAVADVERIVADGVKAYMRWRAEHRAGASIRIMREAAERVRGEELARLLLQHPDLDAHAADVLERFTRTLVGRVLHEPTLLLREHAAATQAAADARDLARSRILFPRPRVTAP